jgi:hypothetical protein
MLLPLSAQVQLTIACIVASARRHPSRSGKLFPRERQYSFQGEALAIKLAAINPTTPTAPKIESSSAG